MWKDVRRRKGTEYIMRGKSQVLRSSGGSVMHCISCTPHSPSRCSVMSRLKRNSLFLFICIGFLKFHSSLEPTLGNLSACVHKSVMRNASLARATKLQHLKNVINEYICWHVWTASSDFERALAIRYRQNESRRAVVQRANVSACIIRQSLEEWGKKEVKQYEKARLQSVL